MWILAYGEFDSTTFWGRLFETLPFFVVQVAFPLGLYVLGRIVAGSMRYRVVGIAVFLIGFLLLSPSLWVGGAWGPAHVAFEVGMWAYPAFFILLVGTTVALYRRDARTVPDVNGRCPRCGYDLRGRLAAGCPECGWNRMA